MPKIIKGFFPSIILGIFLICTFMLQLDELNDRLANLSICLLAYVAVLEQMRCNLPEISSMTIGDKFLMTYIVTSCFPVVYMLGKLGTDDPVEIQTICTLIDKIAIFVAIAIYSGTLVYLSWKVSVT